MVQIATTKRSVMLASLLLLMSGVTSFTLRTEDPHPEKCIGLAIEGGGDKGAFEAGAIYNLTKALGAEAAYDVLTGVSIGGVNSVGLSIYSIGDYEEQDYFNTLTWKNMSHESHRILKSWRFGVLEGLLQKQGLYDFHLAQFLQSCFDKFPKIYRPVTVGAVNARTGAYTLFNSKSITPDQFAYRMQASASIPFVVQPTQIDGEYYIDGGSTYNVLAAQVVTMCREQGYKDSQIYVDVLMSHPTSFDYGEVKTNSIFSIMNRLNKIRAFYQTIKEVKHSVWEYEEVNWRYLVTPDAELDKGYIPINFDQPFLDEEYDFGEYRAYESMSLGPYESFKKYLHLEDYVKDVASNEGGRKESPHMKQMRAMTVFV